MDQALKKQLLANPYPPGFDKVDLADRRGPYWRVEKFTVTERDVALMNLRALRDGMPHRVIPPGSYTRLKHKSRGIVMSDTPAGAHEQFEALRAARGDVLVGGLGLGMFVDALLRKEEVRHVTVVEESRGVAQLTWERFKGNPRCTLVVADLREWVPPRRRRKKKYDLAWLDIWDSICADNLDDMAKLKLKFRRVARRVMCWSERELRQRRW